MAASWEKSIERAAIHVLRVSSNIYLCLETVNQANCQFDINAIKLGCKDSRYVGRCRCFAFDKDGQVRRFNNEVWRGFLQFFYCGNEGAWCCKVWTISTPMQRGRKWYLKMKCCINRQQKWHKWLILGWNSHYCCTKIVYYVVQLSGGKCHRKPPKRWTTGTKLDRSRPIISIWMEHNQLLVW